MSMWYAKTYYLSKMGMNYLDNPAVYIRHVPVPRHLRHNPNSPAFKGYYVGSTKSMHGRYEYARMKQVCLVIECTCSEPIRAYEQATMNYLRKNGIRLINERRSVPYTGKLAILPEHFIDKLRQFIESVSTILPEVEHNTGYTSARQTHGTDTKETQCSAMNSVSRHQSSVK